jgi:hypothetical protein
MGNIDTLTKTHYIHTTSTQYFLVFLGYDNARGGGCWRSILYPPPSSRFPLRTTKRRQ